MSNRDVFISYHSSSSEETVQKIAAALAGAGISCWYAGQDAVNEYPNAIVDAIQGCKIFLLILNEHSNISLHVHNEINIAIDRVKAGEDIVVLPFRVDHCPLSADVYYFLCRVRMLDGSLPPELARIQELVGRIKHILGMPPQQRAAQVFVSGTSRTYGLVGSPVSADNHFVGRSRELTAIHTQLMGSYNKLFLVGMGGIGKSEIARKYLQLYGQDHQLVQWVSFSGSLQDTIADDYAFPIQGLKRADFPEDSPRDYFLRKLDILRQITDRQVLLVLDNFDVGDDPDLEQFLSGPYGVLVTTRVRPDNEHYPFLEIREMTDPAELMGLVTAEYKRPLTPAGKTAMTEVFRLLDNHTLSIRLAASAMQKQRMTPEKLAELLRQGSGNVAAGNIKAADLIYGRLKQVFRLSVLTEEEQYLLKNLSLISLRGIEVVTLFQWLEREDYEVIDELIRKSWIVHDPVSDEVHLHPLIADLMNEALREDLTCCDKYLDGMIDCVSGWQYAEYDQRLQYADFARTAWQRLPKGSAQYRRVLAVYAEYVKEQGCQADAISLFRELAEDAVRLWEQLNYTQKISHSLFMDGDYPGAIQIAQQGLRRMEDIPEAAMDRPLGNIKVHLVTRITESSRALGDHEISIAHAREALRLSHIFYNKTLEGSVGWSSYHLAASLIKAGQLEEAETLLQEAISMFDRIGDRWSACFSIDQLAQIAMRREQYPQALAYSKQAGDIMIAHSGPRHRNIANSLLIRADIYFAMGDTESGNACLRESADIFQSSGYSKKAKEAQSKMK